MGLVYRARDVTLDRGVAVKLLRDQYPADSTVARRFLEEARITGQLQHPGIPAVHQFGTLPNGRPFLAMKLIKGQTLAARLAGRADPAADRGEFVAVFEQVCQAVAYAHAHGVIHRDLKPANVMVGAFGEVQVMDWGLAKVLTGGGAVPGDDSDETLGTEIRSSRDADEATQAGSLLGTPAFMPPEQAAGAVGQVDRRSDVFGLGAILCAVLTGQPPYVADTAESTRLLAARGRLDDALARLAACGAEPDLVALCRACLAPDRADRPADAGEVATAVAALRADAEQRARRAELSEAEAAVRAAEERKRRRVVVAAAAVLAVGAGVAAWQAVRATRAEGRTAEQLILTQQAEEKARDGERKERSARETADAVSGFMRDVFARGGPDRQAAAGRKVDRFLTVKEAMDEAVGTIAGRFRDRPDIEARVRNTVALTYRDLGERAAARDQFERSLALLRVTAGDDHPDTLAAANNLATQHIADGQYGPAEALLADILARLRRSAGDDPTAVPAAAANLGLLYWSRAEYARAEPLLREARDGLLAARGPDDPGTLMAANNLSQVYAAQGKADVAEPLLTETLVTARRALGPTHSTTLICANNLAELSRERGRTGDAEKLLRQTLDDCRRDRGPTDETTLACGNNLGLLYFGLGRLGPAEELFAETLAGCRKALSAAHPMTLQVAGNLAVVHRERGRLDRAVALGEETLADFRKALPADHPNVLMGVSNLGVLYVDAERFGEAVPLLREAADGYARRQDQGPYVVPICRAYLGLAELGAGRPADAGPHLLAGYDGLKAREKELDAKNRALLRRAADALVAAYVATNQPARAAEWRAKRAALPPETAPPPRPAK
jgi:tRNA A-37 threonylcarbamoyl transferase component Bud32